MDIISLSNEASLKLLTVGKVKKVSVVCRLKEEIILKQCFRCLEFSSIAAKCIKAVIDQRDAINLGKKVTYSRSAKLQGEKGIDCRHIGSSRKRPAFSKAFDPMKK